jgi:hypothetical protein
MLPRWYGERPGIVGTLPPGHQAVNLPVSGCRMSCTVTGQAWHDWRAEGVPLMTVKKILTAAPLRPRTAHASDRTSRARLAHRGVHLVTSDPASRTWPR